MDNDFGLSSDSQTIGRRSERTRVQQLRDPVGAKPTLELTPGAGETVFETVVAAMWSDGELRTTEVDRGRAVARVLDVNPSRGGSAFSAIAQGSLPFEEIPFSQLNACEARLAFAASEWATATADEPSSRRRQFLHGLQLRLRLDDAEAAGLRDLALSAAVAHANSWTAFCSIAERVLATHHRSASARR